VIPPGGINYALTPAWLRTTRALAQALGARLIMGINLAADRPAHAAAEARALLGGIGASRIEALEIGNEPDLYDLIAWYDQRGKAVDARGPGYNLSAYTRDFSRWRAVLPAFPLAGPALAGPGWMGGLSSFLSAEPEVKVVTYHRYPLIGCVNTPTSPAYPSIANLLSNNSSIGLAQPVAPFVAAAHARGLEFRIGEMNSVACKGKRGVSDTFASALWMLDTLFSFASVGVDGVNIHSLPGAAYEPFTFTEKFGLWSAFVHPEYYAMLMFAQAFPPGAQLLSISAPTGPVRVWATRAPGGTVRVVLINKDPSNSYPVQVQVPGSAVDATEEWLQAPSVSSTNGVTIGGQTFGNVTTTGLLAGTPSAPTVAPVSGTYSIDLPAASGVMLTL
jgi:Glycosyl hydrolase family 79 C-terminal beta domain